MAKRPNEVNNKRLLVCDLDNTLYDWVGYFVPSFYAMIDAVVEITDCDREELLNDFRKVHQKYGDAEQPFALLETDTIKRIYREFPANSVIAELDPAFHAFNSARKKTLKLHPHVRETLELLRASSITLVAHTESKLYGVVDRLNRLELFQYFAKIYCRERSLTKHPKPRNGTEWLEQFPMEKITELSHHQAKPNAAVLLEICSCERIAPEQTAYVGDSIARDVLMAKHANVFSIWAAYGARHDPVMYSKLVRISHWTSEEVMREQKLRDEAKNIEPDYIAHNSFAEVLTALNIDMAREMI
jgi:phosphoglycolate phosphatase-like HAD superfamily hydrolase